MIGALEREMRTGGSVRPFCLRSRDVESLLTERELEGEQLRNQMRKSLEYVLDEQDSVSNFFPAAGQDGYVGHYNSCTWIRDDSMIGLGLYDPIVRAIYPNGTQLGDRIRSASIRLVGSMLDLFGTEPWSSAFEQTPIEKKDSLGRMYKKLSQPAPPIHFKIDGESCDWPEQNQPDSLGESLKVIATALRNKELILDDKRQTTIDKIVQYLGNIDLPNFEHASMWEWGEVHHPASLSTLAFVASGLSDIHPFISESIKKKNTRTVYKLGEEVRRLYPVDYTIPNGHSGKADMATLIAVSEGALNGFFLSQYFNLAYPELGNGGDLGKRRFLNDHYFRGCGEAIWPMGSILEAIVFFDKAIGIRKKDPSSILAERFRQLGMNNLSKIMQLYDYLGYGPELLQKKEEGWVPNGTHLLWVEMAMARASGRAHDLV